MEKIFVTLLTEFIDTNGKKVLDQPDRFKSLFLDFSQNEYRAEVQIFSQFLASKQAQELKNSDDVDTFLLKSIANRFYQTYLFDKSICETAVLAYAYFRKLIDKKTFEAGLGGYPAGTGERKQKEGNHCKNCGKELQKEWLVCPFCKALVNEIQAETNVPQENKTIIKHDCSGCHYANDHIGRCNYYGLIISEARKLDCGYKKGRIIRNSTSIKKPVYSGRDCKKCHFSNYNRCNYYGMAISEAAMLNCGYGR